MAIIIKSISLNQDKDADVIEYLSTKTNVSRYIISLIRDDINQTERIDDKIKRIIEDALKDVQVVSNSKHNEKKEKITCAIRGFLEE